MDKVNKKGQVTIFIVLGIIILIAIALMLYLQGAILKKPLETEKLEQQPQFRGQTELKNYVNQCLQDVALQGLEIIRLQGGYINIPNDVETFTVKDKENKQIKIVDGSKKVIIDPNGQGNQVPFWLTRDSISIPTLSLIENELRNYITKELNKCVNDFKPFRDQNYDISYGSIDTNVDMEGAVSINVNFPINVKREDVEFNVNDFVFTVPLNMRLIYEMASDLALFENVNNYLEDHTKSLISLYSSIDENSLPPFSQSTTNFDCSSVSWNKQNVKQKLKAIFYENLKHLKIENTNFKKVIASNRISQGVYDSFVYEFFDRPFPTLTIDFSYRPEWEFMDYNIKPSSGNALLPDKVIQSNIPFLPSICVYEYTFKYTIDYPVLVEVNDLKSAKIDPRSNAFFRESGYTLQFMLDSYICGNQERTCTGRLGFEYDVLSFAEDYNLNILPESLFCDEEQRISNDITINALDSVTNEVLKDVNVFYYCGSYQNDCFIGNTDSNGSLRTKFPLCINGIIYLNKNNYKEARFPLTVYDEPKRILTFKLEKEKEVDVEVKKIDLSTYVRNYFETNSLNLGSAVKDLNPKESAIITANGPKQLSYLYPDNTNRKLSLSSGNYDLNIVLNGDVQIQDTLVFGQTLKGFKGKWNFGISNIDWNVNWFDIKDKVTFYAFSNYDINKLNPGTWNDIDDDILRQDGTLSAELLYRCEKKIDELGDIICNYDKCDFVAIDGTNQDDFENNPLVCERAFDVSISKDKYMQFIQPQFR